MEKVERIVMAFPELGEDENGDAVERETQLVFLPGNRIEWRSPLGTYTGSLEKGMGLRGERLVIAWDEEDPGLSATDVLESYLL